MVELITVMVVLGVVSAVAIPRLMGDSGMAAAAYRNELASALRYAQKTAVSHRRMVCAQLDPALVTLTIDTSNDANAVCNTVLAGPIDSAYASTDSAVSASGALVGGVLYFHPNGSITSDSAGASIVAGSISIDAQGASHASITVQGATGHVD
jgi:MSHA pilin protein MshC